MPHNMLYLLYVATIATYISLIATCSKSISTSEYIDSGKVWQRLPLAGWQADKMQMKFKFLKLAVDQNIQPSFILRQGTALFNRVGGTTQVGQVFT